MEELVEITFEPYNKWKKGRKVRVCKIIGLDPSDGAEYQEIMALLDKEGIIHSNKRRGGGPEIAVRFDKIQYPYYFEPEELELI